MAKINPLNAYKETKIRTASQGQLIVMIYDEAIRQLDIATSELSRATPQLDVASNAIIKAQDLVTELTVSLDFDRGGNIAKGLFSLYMFFRRQLMEGNMKKNPELLSAVRSMLAELREAWVQIAKPGLEENTPVTGVNIAG